MYGSAQRSSPNDDRLETMQARLSALLEDMESELGRNKPPPRNMPEPEVMKDIVLERISQWAVHRARYRASKAELDRITHYRTILPEGEDDTIEALQADMDECLAGMAWMEKELARTKPETTRAAGLMVGMAMEILSTKADDPDGRLSSGPAMDILKIARDALAGTRMDQPLTPWA
jgi:hypothetical protein